MFDTWGPGYPCFRVGRTLKAIGWLYRRLEHHFGSVFMLDAERRVRYLREKAVKTCQEIVDLVKLQFARARAGSVTPAGGRTNTLRDDVDEGFIAIASRAYRPSFYAGKVILFRSKQQPLGIVEDPTLGWGGLAADLEIHDVLGLHAAVVAEPRVKYLLEKFLPCLERAQADHAPCGGSRSGPVGDVVVPDGNTDRLTPCPAAPLRRPRPGPARSRTFSGAP
jgi:hypothetical protein